MTNVSIAKPGLLAAFILAATAAFAGQPFSTADLWAFRQAGEPQAGGEGRRVVYSVRWNQRADGAACSNLWLAPTGGGPPRELTSGPWRDRSPRWAPGGTRIAYLSDRDGDARIRIRSLSTGADAAVPIAGPPPLAFAWSPDGRWLAFTAEVATAPAAPWAPPGVLQILEREPSTVQVFVVAAEGGTARQLSRGTAAWRGEPVWMPQGDWILNAVAAAPGESEIYGLAVADGEVRQLTHGGGRSEHPLPSPDGTRIAWIASAAQPASYAVKKLWTMGRDGAHIRMLTGQLDRDVAEPQWSADSRTLYFLADDRGSTHVYAARADGTVRQVTTAPERLSGFSLADNGHAVAVRTTADRAGELIDFPVDVKGAATVLDAPNRALLADRDAGRVEAFAYESAGRTIDAWLTLPPGFDAGRRYRLLLDIRDNPRAMCGGEFDLRAQVFAARGIAVLCANPRGTPGYGEVFGALLRSRYPGDDFDDLMRGVDAAVARGAIDPRRLYVAGGVVAAWAIGHTDRFAAAIVRQPIADWTGDVTLSAEGYRHAAWMGAWPWEDPAQYTAHSPLYFAGNFKTPTLAIAGDPDTQSRELYAALRQRKVETALARPGGGAGGEILEIEATLAWLENRVR